MKHFRTLMSIALSMILGFSGVVFSGVNGIIDVAAAGVVCTSDLPYEVSSITAKDVFTVNACYATLAAAQTAMTVLASATPNVVVRHPASFSPSKIIAMNRGIAVTYDFRSDTYSTVNLYANYNTSTMALGGTTTYILNHRDMQYLGTMGFNAATGTGIIKIKASGYVGYIDLKNTDLIPMIYLDNAWAITLGGPSTSPTGEAPFSVVPRMNIYTVKPDSYGDVNGATKNTRILTHEYFSMWDSRSYGQFIYGPAPDWLPNGTYYSWDGITFFTDRDCLHPIYNGTVIGHYYQYFQYLPLRSDTKYTGAEIEAYVDVALGFTKSTSPGGSLLYGQGASFVASQTTYGMNALLLFSLACHESAFGTSPIAFSNNNLFGWGAADSNPGDSAAVFAAIAQSIDIMMGINLRGYLSPENWRFLGSDFGSKNSGMNVKYASDLYWAEAIAGRAYKVDRWLGSKDYGAVDYAIFNDNTTLGLEKTEGNDTTDLYVLGSFLKDESIIFKSGNLIAGKLWIKTPTTMPLDASGNPILFNNTSTQLVPYNRSLSNGFIIASNNYTYMLPKKVDGSAHYLVQTLTWNTNKLTIAGYGFINGYNVPNLATARHTLNLVSTAGTTSTVLGDGILTTQLTTDFGQGLLVYDGATYNSPSIDVSALAPGSYTFGITVAEDSYGISANLPFNYAGALPANQIINGKLYVFTRLPDGTVVLNVTLAILIAAYNTAPTNQDITVTASAVTGTLNATSHTFTENGSFTFTLDAGAGGIVTRTITIDNIDKVAPVITIAPYPTEMQDTSLTVTATTNEGTLNAVSHTFQMNGSFNFVATDAAGNVTTTTVTIANINAHYKVDFAVAAGQGTLTAVVGATTIASGDYLTPGSNVVLTVAPVAGYAVTQWIVDGVAVANNLTNTLTISNITASISVTVSMTLYGDVNNDGKLSTTDIVMLRRYLAGLDTLSELGKLSGDYNRDGKISTTDIVMMRRKLAGLE